jgi:hypothetical protein
MFLALVLQRCRTYGAASGVASIPEMIGERVFVRDFDVEDGFASRWRRTFSPSAARIPLHFGMTDSPCETRVKVYGRSARLREADRRIISARQS